ncbi:bifunctional adenosylcobinamide kinase/adenosylcobinamide-phosphate guanylyltransferase [Sulfurimonas sp. SAG-AH-194-L11]|nr:bifunctional adenosylcobinamide kinase/adenosylcobinamide-phosphate guanylyltransferase [Sulfurimonas sp. SAG-AH-194-L11]MDF1876280.1 bifunctional adenosylcobinamide kinase/adenosylcobinamide-phosphate guanylyltransferase [Sulfurimonas sp. SAG-AH-194-L11]
MKTLFIGGIKSGKSFNAEKFILTDTDEKPIYLATTEFFDDEMREKVRHHQNARGDNFITIEEPLALYEVLKSKNRPVLVECISMWINNMLYHKKSYEQMHAEIKSLLTLKQDIVFVLNDVGTSVVSENRLVREFVNINGKISQLIAGECDNVYHVVAGISSKIK